MGVEEKIEKFPFGVCFIEAALLWMQRHTLEKGKHWKVLQIWEGREGGHPITKTADQSQGDLQTPQIFI